MTGHSWLSREPTATHAAGQVARLARRAVRRRARVLSWTFVLSLLCTLGFVLKKRTYEPHVLLRVVEADRDPTTAPRPNRKLREHVRDAVFSSQNLMAVMEKHGLYQSLASKNPRAALDSFREDISIDVYRNYFIEERSPLDPPRSARISLGYRAEDPSVAVAVSRDLGALLVKHESDRRRDLAGHAAHEAALRTASARDALSARQMLIAEKTRALDDDRTDHNFLEVLSLTSSLEQLELELDRAERMQALLDFGAAIEASGLGLRFDMVDRGAVEARFHLSAGRVLQAALVSFIGLLPFVGLAIGAFSKAVDEPDDVERLGIRSFGSVRSREVIQGESA